MPTKSKRYKGPLNLKRYHWYSFLTWFVALIFPPFGALVRFGWGKDFFICLVLTLLGWIPGQVYNFYIQNIRNNYNKERTPKWAIRYKLVDVEKYKKRQQRNAWRDRYEGGIDSSGMFDARSSMSSDSSGKPFDVPFNTGSGPIDTGSGSGSSNLVSDLQAVSSRASSRSIGSMFKGMTRKRGKKAHKKDRWERSRISREELDPDYDTEEPEEPVGLYSSARTSREVRAEDNGNLAPDLRHEF